MAGDSATRASVVVIPKSETSTCTRHPLPIHSLTCALYRKPKAFLAHGSRALVCWLVFAASQYAKQPRKKPLH